jgi:uncharacterized oxidoreductase
MLLPRYVEGVRSGKVVAAASPGVVSRHLATAIVDGNWGWGQVAAQLATETVCSLAAEYGVGSVVIRRCNHIGRLGEYVESIARAGLTGLVLCNTGPVVAPFRGRARRLGTNPIAWAAPVAGAAEPIVVDFATSVVAGGKVGVALAKDETVAPGVLIDAAGRDTVSPAEFLAGGALLPFGGHKGYGLSVMVELLGGGLSGAAPSCLPEFDDSNGTLMIAFSIPAFQPLDRFLQQAARVRATLRATPPAPGYTEVEVPGDPEVGARRRHAAHGIPLPIRTVSALNEMASRLGVPVLEA